jgi:hypothetical protein
MTVIILILLMGLQLLIVSALITNSILNYRGITVDQKEYTEMFMNTIIFNIIFIATVIFIYCII